MDPVLNKALLKLSERAKELECLHKVEDAIKASGNSEDGFFNKLVDIIPMGMQFSTVCEVRITYGDRIYKTDEYHDSRWMISSELHLDNEPVGEIRVVYTQFVGQGLKCSF
jgi:pyruvate, water dikinase